MRGVGWCAQSTDVDDALFRLRSVSGEVAEFPSQRSHLVSIARMTVKNIKVTIAAAYVVIVVAAALVGGVTSRSGWTAVIALALLPAAAMVKLWNDAPMTGLSRAGRR